MKKIHNPFSWHNRDYWWWPDGDIKLQQAIGTVNDIDEIMKFVPEDRRRVCIQAGGACGVWPARFAQFFERVFTFEPVRSNLECLFKNIPENVVICRGALGFDSGIIEINRHASESGNSGAWYISHKEIGSGLEEVHQESIDEFLTDFFIGEGLNNMAGCDLLQLDIEGAEYDALLGAQETITNSWPVIVIEEKRLPQMTAPHTKARQFLEDMGYTEVAKLHRDVVFIVQ